MFKKIKIENFKNFNSIAVSNLSRVNVFFGENNCGKSSLLEAMFILSGITNPELFLRINHFRGYKGIRDASYFFHNFNTRNAMSFIAEGDPVYFNRSSAVTYTTDTDLNFDQRFDAPLSNARPMKLSTTARIAEEQYHTSLSFESNDDQEHGRLQIVNNNERITCGYLPPYALFETIYPMVSEIMKDKQEHIIIETLKNIDTRIHDFIISGHDILVDIGLGKRIPLQLLGDGARKLFALIILLYSCRNGVLLVDEIDNGLHYSVMAQLWNVLLRTARQFNVQLFATTHNIDSLKGLEKTLSVEENTDFQNALSLYKLIHRANDSMQVLRYDYAAFSTLLQNENEIR